MSHSKLDSRVYPIVVQSLLTGTAIGIILPVMPLYARELGISQGEYGLSKYLTLQ